MAWRIACFCGHQYDPHIVGSFCPRCGVELWIDGVSPRIDTGARLPDECQKEVIEDAMESLDDELDELLRKGAHG